MIGKFFPSLTIRDFVVEANDHFKELYPKIEPANSAEFCPARVGYIMYANTFC